MSPVEKAPPQSSMIRQGHGSLAYSSISIFCKNHNLTSWHSQICAFIQSIGSEWLVWPAWQWPWRWPTTARTSVSRNVFLCSFPWLTHLLMCTRNWIIQRMTTFHQPQTLTFAGQLSFFFPFEYNTFMFGSWPSRTYGHARFGLALLQQAEPGRQTVVRRHF